DFHVTGVQTCALPISARVRGLAMVCASPRFVRGDDWLLGMSPEIFRGFALGLRADYRATLERFIALEAFGSDDARHEMRMLRDEIGRAACRERVSSRA